MIGSYYPLVCHLQLAVLIIQVLQLEPYNLELETSRTDEGYCYEHNLGLDREKRDSADVRLIGKRREKR